MSKIRKRLTYSNVMSSLAVFLVLGGASAYAAKKIGSHDLKANSVTTAKIKKNAVTTAKIKKNAITTAKIKNDAIATGKIKDDAITGDKVKVDTLGEVPKAKHAIDADNAVNATNFSRYFTSGVVTASGGQEVQLLDISPFKVTGYCEDLGGGEFESWIELTTSQANSSMAAYEDAYDNSDFDPGDEAEIGYTAKSSGPESTEDYYPYYYNGWDATSADGKTLLSGLAFNGVNMFGAPCSFWISGTNNG